MADPGVPVFRGGSGSDCEEFVRAVYAYAFEKDKTDDNKWMATYAATRLSGQALRWYARQDNSVKMDWSALQIALLDQYPPSDDEDGVRPNAQLSPKNVPTPAAAAAPSAGVATGAVGSAPVLPLAKKLPIFECKKAKIRVEDKDGTVKGWISTNMRPFMNQLTTKSGEVLHVKAEKVNSGDTELRVLNVNGWSRVGLRWSAATFDPKDSHQYASLKPSDAAGVAIGFGIFDTTTQGQYSPRVWDLDDAGVITLTWRENGGGDPLCVQLSTGNWLTFYSTRAGGLFGARKDNVKLVYEPIE